MKVNRRAFVSSSIAGVGVGTTWAANQQPAGANDRIRVASIGVGGMGRYNLRDFLQMPEVDVVAVCDVWEHNRDRAVKTTDGKAESYSDFRRVLDRKDVDVVVVSTPDHWHAPIVIAACDAGKDVYTEKPLSHTLREGRKMVEAARRAGRVVQVGTQQRSGAHYQEAVDLIRSGKIGQVTRVHSWNFVNESPRGIGTHPISTVPEGLDWDMYLGPAPEVPFHPSRFIYYFRWFWDYSGGKMTDWGTHHFDTIHWAMDVKAPKSVFATGSKMVLQDDKETPDTMEVVFEYPDFIATFSHRDTNARAPYDRHYGIEFFGTDATLFINRSGFQILPEVMGRTEDIEPPYLREVASIQNPRKPWEDQDRDRKSRAEYRVGAESELHIVHVRNFIDCLKTRRRPTSDIETGHYSTSAPHLANIALKVGRKIEWDWKKEEILEDQEANQLLTKEYRQPWEV